VCGEHFKTLQSGFLQLLAHIFIKACRALHPADQPVQFFAYHLIGDFYRHIETCH